MQRQIETPEEVGVVTEKWWETKKILDWNFRASSSMVPESLLQKLGPLVATVSLVQSRGDETKVVFVARSRWFSEIEEQSLVKLKEEVGAAFRDQILAHTEVVWSDWIEIAIQRHESRVIDGLETKTANKSRRDRDGSAYIDFSYSLLKRASFPDGRDMVINHHGELNSFPKEKKAGTDREFGRRGHYQDDDKQYTYIPATPENLAAMADIVRRIDELEKRLHGVLSQSQIKKTLALIAGGSLALEDKR